MSALPPSLPEAPAEDAQLCGFYVGAEEYVIDVKRVEEILQSQTISRLPRAPPLIEGVICLRGTTVPVIDLRKCLRSGLPPHNPTPKCLICRLGRERVAILVDEVSEVVRVKRNEIRPVPPNMADGLSYVVGVCGSPQKPKLLLDLKALLTRLP